MTDPIADMLTRIRNANKEKKQIVDIPSSNVKKAIANVLLKEGFIADMQIIDNEIQPTIRIELKYLTGGIKGINGLKRISKPGLRIYAKAEELPRVLNGAGIALISTSKGVLTDEEARKNQIGGEVLAYIW